MREQGSPTNGADRMPAIGEYRGISLHSYQGPERIEQTVIPEIDRVLQMDAPDELMAFLRDVSHSPEARLAAKRRLLTPAEKAQDRHRKTRIDVALVRALAAGLDCFNWTSANHYNSALQVRPCDEPQAVPRAEPFRSQMRAEKERRREEGARRYRESLAARSRAR